MLFRSDNEQKKTYRIRGAAGGDRVNYPGDVSARTADMDVIKILIHSVICEKAKWLTMDIKDFYLGTPLERPQYIRIPTKFLSTQSINKHNLQKYLHNGGALFRIEKGMYGLPEAGILAQKRLIDLLLHTCFHINRMITEHYVFT